VSLCFILAQPPCPTVGGGVEEADTRWWFLVHQLIYSPYVYRTTDVANDHWSLPLLSGPTCRCD
jgi:hypothetical protein